MNAEIVMITYIRVKTKRQRTTISRTMRQGARGAPRLLLREVAHTPALTAQRMSMIIHITIERLHERARVNTPCPCHMDVET